MNAPIGFPDVVNFQEPTLALLTAAVAAVVLLQGYVLMRCFYGGVTRPNLFTIFCMGALWILPLVTDSIYDSNVYPPNQAAPMDLFSLVSPIGWMMNTIHRKPRILLAGLGVQFLILIALSIPMYLVTRRRAFAWLVSPRDTLREKLNASATPEHDKVTG